ncbi:MAG: tRNA-intron lyase [Methanobacteriaceae archaeon]|nr:tRNA-intron lyase [Methanobacteriaceae archaeon]OPY21772.1 MAG: tRNA-splicing endonuclease [Methanobacterium sp. PtaU1.Bin097]
MNSELKKDLIIIKDGKSETLHFKSHYGNLTEEGLQLSLIEALYLLEKDKIKVNQDGKEVSLDEMYQIIHDNGLFADYLVFRDLRNRGYIIKTGFKYGSEFRLYERGTTPGEGHSNYLVKVASENDHIPLKDLSSYVRVAHGVNKYLLLAVVDQENDITYYNIEWTRP